MSGGGGAGGIKTWRSAIKNLTFALANFLPMTGVSVECMERRTLGDSPGALQLGYNRVEKMMLNLNLSPETEARIRTRASAAGLDVETFVLEALEEKLAVAESTGAPEPAMGFDAWLARCIALHPQVSHFVDDSRESIYEGRGE
jgi:hypothetical protein